MRIRIRMFISFILICFSAQSGFSQTALSNTNKVDQKLFQRHSRQNHLSVLKVVGSLVGKVTEIGSESVEVETRNGIKRSYSIEPSTRFEELQEVIKGLKKGDIVRMETARRGMDEFITAIEKIE